MKNGTGITLMVVIVFLLFIILTMDKNTQQQLIENPELSNHKRIQILSEYYQDYIKASINRKKTLRSIINREYAEFEEETIGNIRLREFLINVRGY